MCSGLSQAKFKMVEPDNLHISLKFLGNLSTLEIEKTSLLLQKLSFQHQPFDICLANDIGTFPNIRNPHIIWIGIKDNRAKIEKIYHSINHALENESFYRKDKHFRAHITLTRIKYLKNPVTVSKVINNIEINNMSQTINEIALMESQLTPKGPNYRYVNRFPLL